jgi:hypothetical protein
MLGQKPICVVYTNTDHSHFDPIDGGIMYLRNVENTTHIHTA